MFLLAGATFLAALIILVLHLYVFKRINKSISIIILITISAALILTATVHGIWLGLTTLIFGLLWLKFYRTKAEN